MLIAGVRIMHSDYGMSMTTHSAASDDFYQAPYRKTGEIE